jgi:hypothetical protein
MGFQNETKAKLVSLIEYLHREGIIKSFSDVENQIEFLIHMMRPEAHPGQFESRKSINEDFKENFSEYMKSQELKSKLKALSFHKL